MGERQQVPCSPAAAKPSANYGISEDLTGKTQVCRIPTGWEQESGPSVGSTLKIGVHRSACFLSNVGRNSDPRRGSMNKRYLVKLDHDERKGLSQVGRKENGA